MGSSLVKFKPMPHQLLMMEYLIKNNGGLLFCEMRTGKTLGAILALMYWKKVPILIVGPVMAMKNWYNWLVAQGFNEDMISLIEGSKKKRDEELALNKPIVIANYEMSLTYKLKNKKTWKVIIFDESYRIANATAAVTQYWMRGTHPEDQVRIGVTGEPAPERSLNFASQYMIIRGNFMGYQSYMNYFLKEWRKNPYTGKDEPIRPSHESEIRVYVQETAHCVTMKSLGLGSEMLYNATFMELNPKQQQWMLKVRKLRDAAKRLVGVPITENPDKLRSMTMERLVAAGLDPETHEVINPAKLKFLLETYRESPEPTIILSHYKAPLFRMQEMFEEKGIKTGLVYGSTGTASQKESVVDGFKAGAFDVFFGQTRSVKFNYDLSRSSITYYANNSYSRDDRAQSEKRTTNLSKKTPVGIMDLCFHDTLDEALVKKLRSKEKVSYSFIDMEFESACFRKRG